MKSPLTGIRVIVALSALASASPSGAQTVAPPVLPSPPVAQSVTGWVGAGAGAGFGVGFLIGFRVFNEARYAERKIWTTAALGAGAGAVAGYFVGKARQSTRPAPPVPRPLALDPDTFYGLVLGRPATAGHP